MKDMIHLHTDEFGVENGTMTGPVSVNPMHGKGTLLQMLSLRKGLSMEVQRFCLNNDTRVFHDSLFPTAIMFYTCLSGEMILHYSKGNQRIGQGISGVEYVEYESVTSTEIRGHIPVQILSVHLAPELLAELTGGKCGHIFDLMRHQESCSASPRTREADLGLQMCAHQALTAALDTPDDPLFMEAKALELVARQLRRLERTAGIYPRQSPLLISDMDKIMLAGEILKKEMDNPPGGVALARRVGLNYNKLLYGFKKIFLLTPAGYLRVIRLQKAYDLIASRNLNITEAALTVGYASLSHFTKSFRKEFGITPKACAKNGKSKRFSNETGNIK
ncbi:AraC family transcriptional regulator [uncultured Desulfobacter sp.]|uniref:helix-turn-helix transcriptional regulator n=1 Tax=uncultured Desulfobacter sp. TaxID=240139 RepID=UPI0029F5BA59|nr:AraC family transcriptional regulator [uncultured Desulfobacter sp.]